MSGVVRLQFSSLELLSLCFCLLSAGITRGDKPGVVKVFAAEGSDVILPCSLSTKENIQSELFDWKKVAQKDEGQKEVFLYDKKDKYNNGRSGQSEQFKGRVSHFPDQLKNSIASITIRNTKMTDRGNYTCDFPNLQPRQIFYVELVVAAAPEPYIRTLAATETQALLQCDVRGASPEPKVEWQDSAGNILPTEEPQVSERGRSYNITLNATVTKTDRYRCVVTQGTIGHQVYAETFVYISEKDSSSIIGSFFGGLLSGAVIGAGLALLVARKFITIRRNKGTRETTESSCEEDQEMPLRQPRENGCMIMIERESERESD